MISARARIRAGWRSLTGELTTVNAAPHAHRVAVRAALAILVPLVVLAVIGRSELAAYASFGAFAAVYGAAAGPPPGGGCKPRSARSCRWP